MYELIREKLGILADAAKYDVSCSSSGSNRKNENKGIGVRRERGSAIHMRPHVRHVPRRYWKYLSEKQG